MAQPASEPRQVLCPKCKSMLVLQTITLGSKKQCPHCNAVFVISAGKAPQRESAIPKDESAAPKDESAAPKDESAAPKDESAAPKDESAVPKQDKGYDLRTDADPAVAPTDLDSKKNVIKKGIHPVKNFVEVEEEEVAEAWQPKRPPPVRLFKDKTFKAPFSVTFRKCYVMLLILSLIMGIVTAVLLPYLDVGSKDSKDAVVQSDAALKNLALPRSFDGLNVGALNAGATFVMLLLGVPFVILTTGLGIAIFRDTYEGSDEFVSWPREWLNNILISASFVLVPLFLGAFPALLATAFLPGIGWLKMPIVVVCTLVLFPLFFLSALDGKSPVMLHSKPVWGSLRGTFPAWKGFYIPTICIGTAIALFLSIHLYVWLKIICAFVLLPFCVMVYFRLLGKLAWYCSGGYDESLEAEK
jgi:hypothetical protein